MAGAAEDLQGDPPNEDLPENLDMGKIQLQDDKAQEGKKKKKKSRSAKKKITGFEGESSHLIERLRSRHCSQLFAVAYAS
jgi:hypothetical protein